MTELHHEPSNNDFSGSVQLGVVEVLPPKSHHQLKYDRVGNVYTHKIFEIEHKFDTTLWNYPNLEGLTARPNPLSRQKKQNRAQTKFTDW